ncbi:MAG: 3-deoxy-D-manno-octulosonic acid transferase [Syntrophaceae bacterium PtaB.Bin038]|nr:MAG: 3-deoxy-D-manno-octulosonic acid transferase [Syntrophaceae bacterium PtaB.Bin038]
MPDACRLKPVLLTELDSVSKPHYRRSVLNVLYNLTLLAGLVLVAPYYAFKILVTGKYRRSIGQKLGVISVEATSALEGRPRIWVHAVSVGEVTAAAPIVAALRGKLPGACILLSTGTETGQAMAKKLVPQATAFMYFPLDLPWVVKRVISKIGPDAVVLTETELWPNFLRECSKRDIPAVLVNGRISPRSFRRYSRTSFFWRDVLASVREIGVISAVDADRIKAVGAEPRKVRVMGNAKYDSLASRVGGEAWSRKAAQLKMTADNRALVAGSTHEGEEAVVLRVYRELLRDFPDLRLLIVPRHPERGTAVRDLVTRGGHACILMSEIRAGRRPEGEVVVVDVIGELFALYSLATVVYCGGSLVPKGGQNILEPAAWGKVVFYGPSMEDFMEEKALLEETGAGICVRDEREMLAGMKRMLSDPAELRRLGAEGRKRVLSSRGAAERYAGMILRALGTRHQAPGSRNDAPGRA